jgi:hypothetical protein
VNGKKSFTEEEVKKYNLTETRAKFMKTTTPIVWFTQLIIAMVQLLTQVQRKESWARVLVLQVKYEEGIGKDVWYFYFDKNLCHGSLPVLR